MDNEEFIAILEQTRSDLCALIVNRFDAMIEKMQNREQSGTAENTTLELHIALHSSIFIGKKPLSVTLPDAGTVEVNTWLKVADTILRDCNNDPIFHQGLMELRDNIYGQKRVLLGSDSSAMSRPITIDEDLYFEGRFGTASLLDVLKHRVLDVVGYDYSAITVCIR